MKYTPWSRDDSIVARFMWLSFFSFYEISLAIEGRHSRNSIKSHLDYLNMPKRRDMVRQEEKKAA